MTLILYCNKDKAIGTRVVRDLQTLNQDYEYAAVQSIDDVVDCIFQRSDLGLIITAKNLNDGEFAWDVANEANDTASCYKGQVIYADQTACPTQKVNKFTEIVNNNDYELLILQLSEYIEKGDWKN